MDPADRLWKEQAAIRRTKKELQADCGHGLQVMDVKLQRFRCSYCDILIPKMKFDIDNRRI